jgi:hypothetical protein
LHYAVSPSRISPTEVARVGAQKLLAQPIDAEVADCIAPDVDDNGHRQVVRNGHCTARMITTGVVTSRGSATGRQRGQLPTYLGLHSF